MTDALNEHEYGGMRLGVYDLTVNLNRPKTVIWRQHVFVRLATRGDLAL